MPDAPPVTMATFPSNAFDAMRQEILNCGGKIFLETPEFFTVRANVPDLGAADYVLCRKDGAYTNGRHPDSVKVGSIFDDLARRDFTVNAIARNCRTGELIDPHCGVQDIQQKIIRCVGSPSKRFAEDKLRVFRALRFCIVKDFSLESSTSNAMREICFHQENFDSVSTERVREELLKMFTANWVKSFSLLADFGLLTLIEQRKIWFKPTVEQKA